MSEQNEQRREVFAFLVNEEKSEYSRYKLPESEPNPNDDDVEYKTFFDKTKSYAVVVIKAEGLKKRLFCKIGHGHSDEKRRISGLSAA